MARIFEFNNLRFSPEMLPHFCNKDDCCVVVYGRFFFPEHLLVGGGDLAELNLGGGVIWQN